MKNYYSILGVTPDSDDAEIKSAYRSLARKYHPDINPDGGQKFKDILEAYETLSDHVRRLKYDTINGFFKTKKTNTSSDKVEQEYTKNKSENFNQQKNEEKSNLKKEHRNEKFSKKFNNIFEDLRKPKKQKAIPIKGSDIFEEIYISIKESIEGTERIINVLHTAPCPHCKGRKFINGLECPVCKGSGEESEHRKINVKIPKKIKNGAKLRIKNEGNKGQNGGKNGDIFLKINIKPSSKMEFEGNNILYKVPITPVEAVLGGKIRVPSLNGNFTLKIPANTRTGQKFRLSGQGLKNGDMIVTVYIEIPSSLSEDEIKLYEKLKKMSSKDIRENLLNE